MARQLFAFNSYAIQNFNAQAFFLFFFFFHFPLYNLSQCEEFWSLLHKFHGENI